MNIAKTRLETVETNHVTNTTRTITVTIKSFSISVKHQAECLNKLRGHILQHLNKLASVNASVNLANVNRSDEEQISLDTDNSMNVIESHLDTFDNYMASLDNKPSVMKNMLYSIRTSIEKERSIDGKSALLRHAINMIKCHKDTL